MSLSGSLRCPAKANAAPVLAAASLALSPLLDGAIQPGVVLGSTSDVSWVCVGRSLLVMSGPNSAHLPNEVSVANGLPQAGERLAIGEGRIEWPGAMAGIGRWWDPRPRLASVPPDLVAAKVTTALEQIDCAEHRWLTPLVREAEPEAIGEGMRSLLGDGPGLTPEGDDVLIGLIATLRLLAPAVGAATASRILKALESLVVIEAPFRTTTLSAALLRHAFRGEVAEPLGSLLRSLTGAADIERALDEICEMGATSGLATACGALIAAEASTLEVSK